MPGQCPVNMLGSGYGVSFIGCWRHWAWRTACWRHGGPASLRTSTAFEDALARTAWPELTR